MLFGSSDKSQAGQFWLLLGLSQLFLGAFAMDPTYEFLSMLMGTSGWGFLVISLYFFVSKMRDRDFANFEGRYNQNESSLIYRNDEGNLSEYHPPEKSRNWMRILVLLWFTGLIFGSTFV